MGHSAVSGSCSAGIDLVNLGGCIRNGSPVVCLQIGNDLRVVVAISAIEIRVVPDRVIVVSRKLHDRDPVPLARVGNAGVFLSGGFDKAICRSLQGVDLCGSSDLLGVKLDSFRIIRTLLR